jgi:uncharacterized membrane protein
MKDSIQQKFHWLFEAGAVLKALDGTAEFVLGLFFFFASAQAVNGLIFSLTGDELTEQPRDWFIQLIFHSWSGFSASAQTFWAIIFVGNGIIKLLLVLALFKEKFNTYPYIAAAFALLAGYQIYHIIGSPSLILSLITIFDIIFIVLIIQEYHFRRVIYFLDEKQRSSSSN